MPDPNHLVSDGHLDNCIEVPTNQYVAERRGPGSDDFETRTDNLGLSLYELNILEQTGMKGLRSLSVTKGLTLPAGPPPDQARPGSYKGDFRHALNDPSRSERVGHLYLPVQRPCDTTSPPRCRSALRRNRTGTYKPDWFGRSYYLV